jgi:hypothetical protein
MAKSILIDVRTGEKTVTEYDDGIPEPTPEELLAAERAAMRCRAAAMRFVLDDMGKLDEVQAVADSDRKASIAWEYEPFYTRNDPFVNALGVDLFTPEEIDDLFRAAMQL